MSDPAPSGVSPTASESAPAPESPVQQSSALQRPPFASRQRGTIAFMIGFAGWLVPGLGHALQKMWGRALVIFVTVAVLVALGAGMRGNIFVSSGGDAFDTLGYIADLGTGCFYFFARNIEKTGPDVSHANGDYGTRFMATAGVLNLLAALHAFEAARGRKA